jgi:DNA-binding Lrp family transcriptional regulator
MTLIVRGFEMVRAYVMIKVGASEHLGIEKAIKERLMKIPGVIKVDSIFGRFDMIAEVEVKETRELSQLVVDKIKGIPGVVSTETFICHET